MLTTSHQPDKKNSADKATLLLHACIHALWFERRRSYPRWTLASISFPSNKLESIMMVNLRLLITTPTMIAATLTLLVYKMQLMMVVFAFCSVVLLSILNSFRSTLHPFPRVSPHVTQRASRRTGSLAHTISVPARPFCVLTSAMSVIDGPPLTPSSTCKEIYEFMGGEGWILLRFHLYLPQPVVSKPQSKSCIIVCVPKFLFL